MPCSAQKVDTTPRGASSGHCEIARRTRGSIGSWAATAAASRPKCHHQDHQNGHPCPDTELSPMSCEMTARSRRAAIGFEHLFERRSNGGCGGGTVRPGATGARDRSRRPSPASSSHYLVLAV